MKAKGKANHCSQTRETFADFSFYNVWTHYLSVLIANEESLLLMSTYSPKPNLNTSVWTLRNFDVSTMFWKKLFIHYKMNHSIVKIICRFISNKNTENVIAGRQQTMYTKNGMRLNAWRLKWGRSNGCYAVRGILLARFGHLSPLSPLEGRVTANQYAVVLSHHLYLMMKTFQSWAVSSRLTML